MNDPNGLIYRDGVYHLFYQYNPYGTTAGNGSWGHATSTDLVHWKRQPLAISTDANEDVWSGSVVYDRTNSSGFGTVSKPPMVAVYTSFEKATGTAAPGAGLQRRRRLHVDQVRGQPGHRHRFARLPRPEGVLGRRPRRLADGGRPRR